MKYLSDVGINKSPENGDLDVDGDIYSNGERVFTKGSFRTVLFNGAGYTTGDSSIPLSEPWTNFAQIVIMASQDRTGSMSRLNSLTIDTQTFAEAGSTYVQLLANTGAGTSLTYKIDLTLSTDGTMTPTTTGFGPYYIRSVVGYGRL